MTTRSIVVYCTTYVPFGVEILPHSTMVIRLAIHKLVLGLRFTRTRHGNRGLGEVEIYREEVEDLEWRVVSDYAVNTVIACRTYHLA